MDGLVHLDREPGHCYRPAKFSTSRGQSLVFRTFVFLPFSGHYLDRLLWSLHSLDHRRCNSIFSKVETTTQENAFRSGAMGLHKSGSLFPFHG